MYSIQEPSAASYCSTMIDLHCEGVDGELVKVAHGTGFFWRQGGVVYLITNWHVITGRNPSAPGTLIYREQPTSFSLCLPLKSNKKFFAAIHPIPLYTDGKPNWIEVISTSIWDVVAIPLSFPSDAYVVGVQDFCHAPSLSFRPGRDVVIIGYPFDRAESHYPVWKRAMIASEPSSLLRGLPQMYLDTPGRPGMSGSPVYFISEGVGFSSGNEAPVPGTTVGNDIESWMRIIEGSNPSFASGAIILEFVGIYSGSMGDSSLDRLNLGLSWFGMLVSALISKPLPGQNSFSPPAGSHPQLQDWQTVRWLYLDELPEGPPWTGATTPAG
jgi:hypothetical protein